MGTVRSGTSIIQIGKLPKVVCFPAQIEIFTDSENSNRTNNPRKDSNIFVVLSFTSYGKMKLFTVALILCLQAGSLLGETMLGPCIDCTGCFKEIPEVGAECAQYVPGFSPSDCVALPKDQDIMTFECSGLYDIKCPSNCTGCAGLPELTTGLPGCYEYDDVSSGHPIVNPMVCKSWGGRDCKEEAPKDDCSRFDGILHKHRAVCCNKKCQRCGGVGGNCAKLKDKEGNVLGVDQCCGKRIEDSGTTCGKNGRKAPCKLPLFHLF